MSTDRRTLVTQRSFTDDYDDDDFSLIRGYIVFAEGMAWGPFRQPEHALAFALKHQPDHLFKLAPLMNPEIID